MGHAIRNVLFSTAAVIGFVASGAAVAQTAPERGNQLEEVIVTAQKREENLQKTPVAVQVVAPENLERQGVKDFINLSKLVPTFQAFQGTGATIISIRGLRSTSYDPTDESPNAIHIDGNYIARSNYLNGLFYDLERVEVLTGPQGTLFGRNAASGAVNIITKKPGPEFGGFMQVEAGNYELLRGQGAINIPVSDSFYIRAAVMAYSHQGYAKSGLDDARQFAGRVSALWKPNDSQSLLFTLDRERDNPHGPATRLLSVYNPAVTTLRAPADIDDDLQIAGGGGRASFIDHNTWGASAQYDQDTSLGTLTVQSAYRQFKQYNEQVSLASFSTTPERSITYTAETRLTSPTGQSFEYVGGLFYFHEVASGLTATYVSPTNLTLQSIIDLEGQTTNSMAAFGQIKWTPPSMENLHIILGARYNYDKKSASSREVIPPIVNFVSPRQTKSYERVTWKAGLSYDLTPENLIYGTASTGYKSGGFVYGANPITPPQTILAYQVGSKNRFLENRLQVNVEAFKYKYKNFQQTYLDTRTFPPVLNVATAGSAKLHGVDFDTAFVLTETDRIRASVSYLHTKYGSFNLPVITGNPTTPNLTGTRFPNVPRWTGVGGYTHTFDLASGSLDANIDMTYGGKRPVSLPTTTQPRTLSQDAFVTVDLSLRYEHEDGRWNLTAYVNNVGDERYLYTGAFNGPPGRLNGTVTGQVSAPRTYGVILGAQF